MKLTPALNSVWRMLRHGRTVKYIAKRRGVAEETARVQVRHAKIVMSRHAT